MSSILIVTVSSCALLLVGGAAVSNKVKENKKNKSFDPSFAKEIKIEVGSLKNLTFSSKRKLKLTLVLLDPEKNEEIEYEVGESDYLSYEDFDITVEGAKIDENYVISTPALPSEITTDKLNIQVTYKHKDGINKNLEHDLFSNESPSFISEGKSHYRASSGFRGDDANGGKNGSDGGHGSHGKDGEKGKNIEAYLKQVHFTSLDREILVVKIVVDDVEKMKYLDPLKQNKLILKSIGGAGADGGDGGIGGNGKPGYSGGRGGDGGDGGYGGKGGNITVHVDPSVDLQKIDLQIVSKGGEGGEAGYGGSGGRISGSEYYADGKDGKPGRSGADGSYNVLEEELPDSIFKLTNSGK